MPRLTGFTCSLGPISDTGQCRKAARPLSPRVQSSRPWGHMRVKVPLPAPHVSSTSRGCRGRETGKGQMASFGDYLCLATVSNGSTSNTQPWVQEQDGGILAMLDPLPGRPRPWQTGPYPQHWMSSLLPWSPGSMGEVSNQAL